MAVPLSAYWRLVRSNRNFRRLWLAQIISEMGDWFYTVAIYTLLLELTGSAKSVALAFVVQVLPQSFVAPIAGVLNDRASRKRVMIAADLARSVIVLGMLVVSRAQIVPLIYALLLLETTMWALFEPGRTAILPNIAGSQELVTANALSSMTWSLNLALGAGLGGAVAAFFGRDAVFVLDSVSFLVSAALLGGMVVREPHLADSRPFRARDLVDFSPVAEGVRYVARDKRIFALLLVKAGLGLLGTHWVLTPIFGQRIFPVKAAGAQRGAMLGMSALMSASGLGSLLGPLVGGYWAGEERSRLRLGILIGFLVSGLGYLLLAAAPSLALASLAMVLANSGASQVWVFSTTLLQFQTDDRYRGRVFAADAAFLVLTMSFITYTCGQMVDWGVSVRLLAAATALLALLPAGAWAFGMRLFTRARRAG
jgi:MFS family permease